MTADRVLQSLAASESTLAAWDGERLVTVGVDDLASELIDARARIATLEAQNAAHVEARAEIGDLKSRISDLNLALDKARAAASKVARETPINPEIERQALSDPFLAAWLYQCQSGRCSYLEAMEGATLALAEERERLVAVAVAKIARGE